MARATNDRYDLIVIGAGGAGSTVVGEAKNRGPGWR